MLEKLGVGKSRLSQLVKARKREMLMSTPEAVYTLAFENGIDIYKHLDPEETKEVRSLLADLRNGGQPTPAPVEPNRGAKRTTAARKQVKFAIAGVDVGAIPALKPNHAAEAKRMSEDVFPLLYIFENSARDLIERVLDDKYGEDWWEDEVPRKVQQRAAENKEAEGEDPWHGRRGARPIDYVFLTDLWAIIKHKWGHFKPIFRKQALIESIITDDMNVSRRPLAHMNPLGADDVTNIKAAFRKWTKLLQAAEDDGDLP